MLEGDSERLQGPNFLREGERNTARFVMRVPHGVSLTIVFFIT